MSSYTNNTASPSSIIAVGVVFPVLCTIAVVLRFYLRYALKVRLMADDWLTIPTLVSKRHDGLRSTDSAQLLTIGMGVSMIVGIDTSLAFGYHVGRCRTDVVSGAAGKALGYSSTEPSDLTAAEALVYTDSQVTLSGIVIPA